MTETSGLLGHFESQRPRLRAVAYRMLGSPADADDAVQEVWLRLSRSEGAAIENLSSWLTTVVSHVCLDMLRSRRVRSDGVRRSDEPPEPQTARREDHPEEDLALADSVNAALLIVLDRLTPAERVAFVLHDMFDLNFDEIAPIVERTPEAARQLASRARRRVRGTEAGTEAQRQDRRRQRQIVDAFLAASRNGDLQGLIALLDPSVVFHADAAAVRMGGPAEARGAQAVANLFKGRAQAAQPGLIDGDLGLIVAVRGQLRVLVRFAFRAGRIAAIAAVADPSTLASAALGVPLD